MSITETKEYTEMTVLATDIKNTIQSCEQVKYGKFEYHQLLRNIAGLEKKIERFVELSYCKLSSEPSSHDIATDVLMLCTKYRLSIEYFTSDSRVGKVDMCKRHLVTYALIIGFGWSYPEVAAHVKRDRATLYNAVYRVQALEEANDKILHGLFARYGRPTIRKIKLI